MRITIETDDKGNIRIDPGDKGNDKPGLFESTADIPAIDAGSAPIEYLKRFDATIATESDIASVTPLARDPNAELPLNPLRAGAAAAYQAAAQRASDTSQQATAVAYQERSSDSSGGPIDGGRAAQIPDDVASESPAPAPSKKSRKNR